MRWEKLAKPLEEIGKWSLNAGLAFLAGLVIQPLVKGKNDFLPLGLIAVVFAVFIGAGLILISELIKEDGK